MGAFFEDEVDGSEFPSAWDALAALADFLGVPVQHIWNFDGVLVARDEGVYRVAPDWEKQMGRWGIGRELEFRKRARAEGLTGARAERILDIIHELWIEGGTDDYYARSEVQAGA